MKTTTLATVLLLAGTAAAELRPVAQWDVVPYQRITNSFEAGVVAFYDKGIKVEFSVDGKKVAEAASMTRNERTRVDEYWFALDVKGLKEGPISVGAKVIAVDGKTYDLPALPLYADPNAKLGSRAEIWVDTKKGIDYSEGTKDRPVKTLKMARVRCGDGGTILLKNPGVYACERMGGGNDRKYWTTIRPAPGLTLKDVQVKGGRTGCDKLRFQDVQLFCDITGGQGYILAGVDANSICWVDNCRMFNRQGRSAALSYPFGNKLTGYVTGGATFEMGNGPCGKLVRNHVMKNLSGDAFTGSDLLAVNCKVLNVDSAGVVAESALHRSQPIPATDWVHDVILANITASEAQCNALIGLRLRDSVFDNVSLDTTGPERRFASRYSFEMENVIFRNVKVTGQEWLWNLAENHYGDYVPTDVRVYDCSFKAFEPSKED
jgi:hypothetical protein